MAVPSANGCGIHGEKIVLHLLYRLAVQHFVEALTLHSMQGIHLHMKPSTHLRNALVSVRVRNLVYHCTKLKAASRNYHVSTVQDSMSFCRF